MSFLSTLPDDVFARRQSLREQILTVTDTTFDELTLAVFQYQAAYNPVYREYLRLLNSSPATVTEIRQIPFMPISFFKTHSILTGLQADKDMLDAPLTFASSGTTGQQTSRHLVVDPELYDAVSVRIFEETYGPLRDFHILALLPSYLERNNSSLVYMVQRFMAQINPDNTGGFYLNNYSELTTELRRLASQRSEESDWRKRVLLIGVTFGLLDWAEDTQEDLSFLKEFGSDLVVMETGGMKGRRKELLREEVHEILNRQLGIKTIHSEYGMTELLSQAYSMGSGVFRNSATLRVLLRDINDPFSMYDEGNERRSGGINVIDLANLDSCSFIETQDLGQYVETDGSFRVIGRFDNSDVRGCNLMIS
ncbi:acyl transferase [Spirosoma sp. KUDC1026]|uniref:LuxE/PaaK family acyltransferase n=1 Tax=Spirosoma sp. KUDC1026 TaxID=2745947 RepID=UPI00159BDDB2|nr:acyl transferase [Spirosoma sp. KUDC1026]QKZ15369.1 acyl transferase [Spirosoma sp. KUDC1026]